MKWNTRRGERADRPPPPRLTNDSTSAPSSGRRRRRRPTAAALPEQLTIYARNRNKPCKNNALITPPLLPPPNRSSDRRRPPSVAAHVHAYQTVLSSVRHELMSTFSTDPTPLPLHTHPSAPPLETTFTFYRRRRSLPARLILSSTTRWSTAIAATTKGHGSAYFFSNELMPTARFSGAPRMGTN